MGVGFGLVPFFFIFLSEAELIENILDMSNWRNGLSRNSVTISQLAAFWANYFDPKDDDVEYFGRVNICHYPHCQGFSIVIQHYHQKQRFGPRKYVAMGCYG